MTLAVRGSSEFQMTLMDESAIAAVATMGDSSHPKRRNRALAAASGMPARREREDYRLSRMFFSVACESMRARTKPRWRCLLRQLEATELSVYR